MRRKEVSVAHLPRQKGRRCRVNTAEIVELVEKFVGRDCDKFKRPFYSGEYAYATDGRACIRARMPGAKFGAESKVAKNIDRFCADFDTATRLPVDFVDELQCEAVRTRARTVRAKHRAQAQGRLRDINIIHCPCCGEEIPVWDYAGEIVSDKDYNNLHCAADGVDGFEPSFPIRYNLWSFGGNAIIDYKYARIMIDACGDEGEFRFGLHRGESGKHCFYGMSIDGNVCVAVMAIRSTVGEHEEICEVGKR